MATKEELQSARIDNLVGIDLIRAHTLAVDQKNVVRQNAIVTYVETLAKENPPSGFEGFGDSVRGWLAVQHYWDVLVSAIGVGRGPQNLGIGSGPTAKLVPVFFNHVLMPLHDTKDVMDTVHLLAKKDLEHLEDNDGESFEKMVRQLLHNEDEKHDAFFKDRKALHRKILQVYKKYSDVFEKLEIQDQETMDILQKLSDKLKESAGEANDAISADDAKINVQTEQSPIEQQVNDATPKIEADEKEPATTESNDPKKLTSTTSLSTTTSTATSMTGATESAPWTKNTSTSQATPPGGTNVNQFQLVLPSTAKETIDNESSSTPWWLFAIAISALIGLIGLIAFFIYKRQTKPALAVQKKANTKNTSTYSAMIQ